MLISRKINFFYLIFSFSFNFSKKKTIIILVFLILFLIRTVFQVFEANNKVISLFALVPIDEIQNL
jgi:hypothetical protein